MTGRIPGSCDSRLSSPNLLQDFKKRFRRKSNFSREGGRKRKGEETIYTVRTGTVKAEFSTYPQAVDFARTAFSAPVRPVRPFSSPVPDLCCAGVLTIKHPAGA